jgi:hypothetical protein
MKKPKQAMNLDIKISNQKGKNEYFLRMGEKLKLKRGIKKLEKLIDRRKKKYAKDYKKGLKKERRKYEKRRIRKHRN